MKILRFVCCLFILGFCKFANSGCPAKVNIPLKDGERKEVTYKLACETMCVPAVEKTYAPSNTPHGCELGTGQEILKTTTSYDYYDYWDVRDCWPIMTHVNTQTTSEFSACANCKVCDKIKSKISLYFPYTSTINDRYYEPFAGRRGPFLRYSKPPEPTYLILSFGSCPYLDRTQSNIITGGPTCDAPSAAYTVGYYIAKELRNGYTCATTGYEHWPEKYPTEYFPTDTNKIPPEGCSSSSSSSSSSVAPPPSDRPPNPPSSSSSSSSNNPPAPPPYSPPPNNPPPPPPSSSSYSSDQPPPPPDSSSDSSSSSDEPPPPPDSSSSSTSDGGSESSSGSDGTY
jgi:hypothetical protein